MSMKILFAAQDPGSANALAPVIKKLSASITVNVLAAKYAVPMFAREKIRFTDCTSCSDAELEQLIVSWKPEILVLGASAGLSIEKRLTLIARARGITTVSVIDYWSGYDDRFGERINKRHQYLPDYVCVIDRVMKNELLELGVPSGAIAITGNPSLEASVKKIQRTHLKIPLSRVRRDFLDPARREERSVAPALHERQVTPRGEEIARTRKDAANSGNSIVASLRSITGDTPSSSLLGLAKIGSHRGGRDFEMGSTKTKHAKNLLYISTPFSSLRPNPYPFDEFQVLRDVLEYSRWKEYGQVVVKLHPKEAEGKYDELIARYPGVPIRVVKDVDLYRLLGAATLIIGTNSIVLLEASIAGKPVVSYQPGLHPKDDVLVSNRRGLSKAIYDKKDLYDYLLEYYRRKQWRPPAHMLRVLKKQYANVNATQNIINLISNIWKKIKRK